MPASIGRACFRGWHTAWQQWHHPLGYTFAFWRPLHGRAPYMRRPTMTPSIASASDSYSSRFLFALIAVSCLPIIIALLNFGVFGGKSAGAAFLFLVISASSSAHVFMNWTYFTSKKWRSYFAEHPIHFYVVPALIIIASIALMVQPIKAVQLIAFYIIHGFVNMWHHSKQNWGVMSIIGRIRGRNVSPMMKPLCYAWLFFAIPLCFTIPEACQWIGDDVLEYASLACLAAFIVFCLYHGIKSRFASNPDPLVLISAIALCCYFVPTVSFHAVWWAVTIWGLAHAGQYYLIVFSSMSLHGRKSGKSLWVGMIVTATMMTALTYAGFIISKTGSMQLDNVWLRLVLGLYTGITLMHFWVDAFIWKFGNSEIRKLHGDAFSF